MFSLKIKRFLEPLKQNKSIFLSFIFLWVLLVWFDMYAVNIIKDVTNLISSWNSFLIYKNAYFYLWVLVFYYIAFFILKNSEVVFFYNMRKTLYKNIFKKFIKLDNSKIELLWTWKLISVLKEWIFTWWELLHLLFYAGFQSILKILASFWLIYFISKKYFFITLIIFWIITIFLFFIDKYTNFWRKKRRDERNNQVKQIVKIIMSKFEILQNNKWDKEINNLINLAEKEMWFWCKTNTWLWYMFNIPKLVVDLARFILIIVVWIWVLNSEFSFWDFVMFWSLLIIIDTSLARFIWFFKDFSRNFTDIEKLFETIDSIPEIKNYDNWPEFVYKNWEIELRNLNFSYDWNKIFENFSLKIEWWKKVAIVWPSGGWKTTLIKLISWFLESKPGQIFVDGQDISDISLKTYYKHIWYLTQEPSIIDASVWDNLTYGIDRQITENEVQESLDLSESEFVNKLDRWLQTEIWERWIRLSGWQRQRLAIAKLFLKAPKIVILDEPTSALDSFSEDKITKALERLFRNKTVVVVAHRLQTVKEADEIIVIDKGWIIERWSHEELVNKWWIYSEMVDLQSWLIK